MTLRRFIHEALLYEKQRKGDKRGRVLYHISVVGRPASPKPKKPRRFVTGDYDVPAWQRWWMHPVKSGVFLTPDPRAISAYHGRYGPVYAYRVPEWVIKKAGGIHRYDHGSELVITQELWEEAGPEIEFLGKSMTRDELFKNAPGSQRMYSHMSGRRYQADPKVRLRMLMSASHALDVIKLMTDDEAQEMFKLIDAEIEDKKKDTDHAQAQMVKLFQQHASREGWTQDEYDKHRRDWFVGGEMSAPETGAFSIERLERLRDALQDRLS